MRFQLIFHQQKPAEKAPSITIALYRATYFSFFGRCHMPSPQLTLKLAHFEKNKINCQQMIKLHHKYSIDSKTSQSYSMVSINSSCHYQKYVIVLYVYHYWCPYVSILFWCLLYVYITLTVNMSYSFFLPKWNQGKINIHLLLVSQSVYCY